MQLQELTLQEMKEVNGGLLGLFGGGGCKNDCYDDRCYDPCKDSCYDPCKDPCSSSGISISLKLRIGICL